LTAAHCVTPYRGGKVFPLQLENITAIFPILGTSIKRSSLRWKIFSFLSSTVFLLTVQPVCIDWTITSDDFLYLKKEFGYVNGWGYTEKDEKLSDVLKTTTLRRVSRQSCVSHLPKGFEIYLTYDKLCALYRNETSISLGVTGGGLVFQHADNRFYIVGILSLFTRGPTALYTNIKVYLDNFLLEKIARYNIL
jgi:hypothetical protein